MIRRPSEALGPEGVALLGADLAPSLGRKTSQGFVREASRAVENESGLFARAHVVASILVSLLPEIPEDRCAILVASSGPARESAGYGPMSNYRFLALTKAASMSLNGNLQICLDTLAELTRRFTSEFEIRKLLEVDFSTVYRELELWVDHPDHHVRRLASEGVRPRLPWASHLHRFKEDPEDLLRLIAPLRIDPSRYVRRSVANNMADVIKDNPEIAYTTLNRWMEDDPNNDDLRWIVQIATRLPRSQGVAEALALTP